VQTAPVASHEMRDHVERRVREGAAEMPGLRIVAEQYQRHAGHEADVLELLQVADVESIDRSRGRREGFCLHGIGFYTGASARRDRLECCGAARPAAGGPPVDSLPSRRLDPTVLDGRRPAGHDVSKVE